MSENGSITVNIKNHIGTITFHHPKGNALPGTMLRELAQKITEIGNHTDVHIIVLRSKGKGAFCAGAFFDELRAIKTREEGKHFFMGFALVLNAMRTCPRLIIVRVQGKTVGGGVGLAAAGDYTLAHAAASIRLSELSLGIGPFVVGPAIRRKTGVSAFSALAMDAHHWHDATWACEKGLFTKVLDSYQELDGAVDELAHTLANSNPEALNELKTALWSDTAHWDSLLEERAEISGRLVLSDYTKSFIREFKKS